MAEIDWEKGAMTSPASAEPDWESGAMTPPSNKGFMSDVGTALKQGVQQLPGALTGLADIPLGLAGMDRPVSRTAERLGAATGFQPGKWAEETAKQYSPETQASRAEIDKAWEDPNAGALDVAGAYLKNPRATALNVVQSVPSIVAGGLVGRAAGLAGLASAPARAALGEGAVMAGQQMDQIDDQVDPQRAAAAALGTGVVGAAAGAASGRIAARMGVRDLETTLAGGATGGAARAPGVVGRVAGGAGQEAAEEAAQSAVEQGAQNWAEGKDLTEGMARNVVEGSLAGGVMGAGAGAVPLSKRMGLDPNAGPLSDAAAKAVDGGAAPLALPAPTVTVGGDGTARTAEQRQAERDAPGPIETGAMGQGRNSEEVAAPAPFPSPEQQPALEYSTAPALGYDTAPTDTLIADADGSVRQETRAEAISRDQQQSEQQAVEDAEAQRRADLGLPPLTPIEPVRPGPARGETLELGADGVARPVDLLPEPTNRIRAGKVAREAGPGHEAVQVEGGWNVRPTTAEPVATPILEPGRFASGAGTSTDGSATESPDIGYNLPKNTTVGGASEIRSLFEQATQRASAVRRAIRFAVVRQDEAARLKAATGLDLTGYRHTVDSHGLQHAIKQHGDGDREAARGQEAITAADAARIPEIVAQPDTVELAGKDATGNDLIRYSKDFEGTTFYVEEVRRGRQELAAKTLWKTRTTPRATPEGGVAHTSGTIGSNRPQRTEILAASPQNAESARPPSGELAADPAAVLPSNGLPSGALTETAGRVPGDALPGTGQPGADYRPVRGSMQARAVAREFLNRPLVNHASGIAATVSGESLRKMLSKSAVDRSASVQAHMQAIGNIDRLFAEATLRETRPPKKDVDVGVIGAVHHFTTTMPFDGRAMQVNLMAKAFIDPERGNRIYLINALEIQGAGVVGGDPGVSGRFQRGDAASSPPSGATQMVAQSQKQGNGAAEDTPMSSVAADAASSDRGHGQGRTEIQQVVDEAVAGWKNPPPVVVVANPNSPGVHPRVRDHYAQPGVIVPNGSYFAGTVYLFTDYLQDGAEALRVLAHEALGHAGLRGFFGASLDGVLDQIAAARSELVGAKAREYGLDMDNQRQRRMAAEEVLAEMAEQNPQLSLVRRAIAAIRTWLRANIPAMRGLALSDAEIVRNFLLPARGFIERGPAAERAPSSAVPASSQVDGPSIAAVELRLDGWTGSASDLSAMAREIYTKELQGTTVRNDSLGVDVAFSAEGKGEAFGARGKLRNPVRAEMVKVLRELVGASVKVAEAAPGKGRAADSKAFHTLVAPLLVNGQMHAVRVTVREALLVPPGQPPHKFYDVTSVQMGRSPGVYGFDQGASTQSRPTPSEASAISVSALARAVGIEGSGQVDAPMSSKAALGSSMGNMTPAQEAAWKRVAQLRTPPTLRERFDTMRANLGTKMRAGILDQFAPIKEVSEAAYVQARLSKGSDGTMEAALLYGKPFLRDGAADVDVKDGGFAQVLASLKGEHDRFLMWVAAQRAERLAAEGKENLFTSQDIGALKTLNAGRFDDGTARMPVYARALRDLNAFNDSVLAMAEQSGLIDPAARALFKDQPYVPFYRVMEEGDMRGPKFSSGLVNQQAFKKLKGGSQQLNADLLENMLMNWSHLYSAAARNRAAQATMDAADKLAIAHQVPEGTKGAVRVMRAGVAEHWAVEDPHLLEAITALNYAPSPLMKPLAVMKNILTYTVTVNPTFKIRNLIRDSLSAISQADLSYNPLKNIADGWRATAADSQIYASMLASGGTIRFGTQENSARLRAQVEKLGGQVLDKEGWRKLADQVRTVWSVYEEFGDRTENVNRAALYEQLVKKGHSHAEAAFMARDLMDFSMAGSWPLVRFLGQTVPFFNARLQGLYKLGRAAAEDPRRFGTMAAAVSLASLGLMAAYQDDDDWKKREDWDRDAYWWFKVGGTAFRIPKPFELGAIGTIAERSAELMLSDEMTGKRFGARISDMVFGTFAMDPTPQIIKPLLDVYANKDSFTGRAIEGMSDERLRPQDRAGERTTEVARFLGQLGLPDPVQLAKGEYSGLSPKQIDFLLRGYFGWVGTTAAQLGDRALRPLMDRGERPAMELRDTFLAGNFIESLPSGSSRYVTELYDRAREVDQAYASYRDALKRGDTEKAQQIREEEGGNLLARRRVDHAKQQLAKINAQARMVEASRTLSADEKRQRLDVIEERRDRVARLAASVQ